MKKRSIILLAVSSFMVLALGISMLVIIPGLSSQQPLLIGLQTTNDGQYYYDDTGTMQTGLQTIGGKLYYFDANTGKAIHGWYTDANGDSYYFGTEGYALTGEQTIDGKAYTFGADGRLQAELKDDVFVWQVKDGKYYCVDASGNYLTGLQNIDGILYYFDELGARQTGWQTIDGNRYYFSETDGRGAKGWYTAKDGTYYLGENGYALTGQQTIDGKVYTFDKQGRLVVQTTGTTTAGSSSSSSAAGQNVSPQPDAGNYSWKEVDGKTYYQNNAGAKATGLQSIDGAMYYFDSDGVRQTGWQTVSGQKYYFSTTDGKAATGWMTDSEDSSKIYYFGEVGYALTNLQVIDGDRYYFNSDGVRETGWKEVSGNLYRFNSSTGKAEKGWYTTDQVYQAETDTNTPSGSAATFMGLVLAQSVARYTEEASAGAAPENATYYFGPDGFAMKGLIVVEGSRYYLNDRYIMQTGWQTVGGRLYSFDSQTGAAVSGWAELPDGAGRGYLSPENGYAVTGLQKIEDRYYCFQSTGAMITGWVAVDGKQYYFDPDNGFALQNQFLLNQENGATYYMGPDGFALTGLQTIGSSLYYFNGEGARQAGWQQVDDKNYFFNAQDGAALKSTWQQRDGAWYYLGSEAYAVTGLQTIDNSIYYFSTGGVRQTGWQVVDSKNYFFDEDGKAFAGWQTIGAEKYYFTTEGYAATGLVQLGDAYYFFNELGAMQTGWQTAGGKRYNFNAENSGKARTGWYSEGANRYYLHDTEAYALTGNHKIGDVTYTFDDTGLVIDETWENYTWYEKDGNKYFSGPNGKYVTGLQTIEGKVYYFNATGAMQTGLFTIEDRVYMFSEDGPAYTQWYADEETGNTYYFDDTGAFAYTGVQYIGSEHYYFSGEGVMQTGWFAIAQEKYFFQQDGKAPKGFFTDTDGKLYFFGGNGYVLKGLQTVDGKKYYFNAAGEGVSGQQLLDGRLYFFVGENGAAATGWYENETGKYYLGQEGYALNGLQTITEAGESRIFYFAEYLMQTGWQILDGNRYFFAGEGAAATGWYTNPETNETFYFSTEGYAVIGKHLIDGTEYQFNQDGVLISTTQPNVEAWLEEDGNIYYLNAEGERVTGLYTVEGSLYYFNEEGVRQTGWQQVDGKRYYFALSDGKGLSGWQNLDEATYYFGAAGFALTGQQTIGEKEYSFDSEGKLTSGESEVPENNQWHTDENGNTYYINSNGERAVGLQTIDGFVYYFDANGIRRAGAVTVDGGNYYFAAETGKAVLGWQQIEGRWYRYHQTSGKQLLGWQYRALEDATTETYYYYEDGTLPSGWVDLNGINRYFFADGHMALGWESIEGKTYYFLTSGKMATGAITIDGVSYYFDSDGQLATGWQADSAGNRYYYTEQGAFKGWNQIDEKWYVFDSSTAVQLVGWQYRPLEDGSGVYTYYYDETSGSLPASGFGNVNGINRYFFADGHMAVGWQTIEEQTYYFAANGEMATGMKSVEGTVYYFAQTGQLQTGWQTDSAGNRYYFAQNGMATGWNKISDRWYYLHEQTGVQQLGWQTRTTEGGTAQYYYFSNGELPAAGWSTEVESTQRYILADGQMAQGWQTIEGARYYFAANGAPLTNWQTIASRWYNFSSAGVQQTGWQEKIVTGGTVQFYYNADGSLPAAGWNDSLDGARRYVLADGQMAQGWQTIAGYKYYFETDGTAKTGSHTIDGTICIFDTSGRYVAPPSILAVNYDTAWSATKAVTVTGSANSLLADQTLQYSFDGGVTWQAENSKSFSAGTVLAAGTIRIRDSIGNIVLYNTQITLANTGGTSFGIDVSAHQGLINWAAVKASGVEFAIIRSLSWNKTTNYYGIDPYFEYNVRNAKANGIKVGTYLYSYAFSREEMQEEITYFINSTEVQNLLREGILFDMPVFIDYEDPLIVSNTTNLTIDQRTDIVRYGMQLLEQMSNYKMLPGFYTYYNFAKTVINGAALQAEGFEFWLARFNTSAHGWSPAPPIWQYSSTGTVSGISGNVDLNYSYKDYSFINGGTVPPASSSYNLTVTNQSGQVVTASAATILAQIVQAEVGGFGNAEVFKAQAVAAQSWILYQQSQGYSAPQVALSSPTAAVQTAVNAVVNQTLTYNGSGAFTPYYAYSNGTTNNSQYWGSNLPYLASVSSSGDSEKAAYTGQISYGDLKARIEAVYGSGATDGYAPADWIKITGRNAAGYVTSVSVCGRTPTVDYFYQTIIRYSDGNGKLVYPIGSPSFEISFNGSNMWTFTTRGYGHGVGMSQYGAYKMALSGSTYSQILAHYYPGTQITTVG